MKDECKTEIIIALINSYGISSVSNVDKICEAYKKIEKAMSAPVIND